MTALPFLPPLKLPTLRHLDLCERVAAEPAPEAAPWMERATASDTQSIPHATEIGTTPPDPLDLVPLCG